MREGMFDHVFSGQSIRAAANASGIAQGWLGPVPEGYVWYVERMTSFTPAHTTEPVCEVFVLSDKQLPANYSATVGDRAGRQDVSRAASNDVADEESPIYVGSGYFIVAGWTGLTELEIAQLTFQIAVHQKLPQTMARWQQAEAQSQPVPDDIDVPDPLGQQYVRIPT